MTSILGERAMTNSTSFQPVPPPGQGVRFDAPHDAHEVAKSLRQLTLRAFQAVKPAAPPHDRRDVHGEIVEFEAALDHLGLSKLMSYTSALRRRVESSM